MNLWVLIAMVAIVGILVFGSNPVRDFQNEQQELMNKYGKDDITARTNIYLEQKKRKDNGGMFGDYYPQASSGKEQNSVGALKSAMESSASVVGNDNKFEPKGIKVAEPSVELEGYGNGDLSIIQSNDGSKPAKPRKTSNYYPPIAGAARPQPTVDENQIKPNGPKLRSGQSISYEGTAVYTINSEGKKALLPDGEYTLQDGSVFRVSGGHRLYAN